MQYAVKVNGFLNLITIPYQAVFNSQMQFCACKSENPNLKRNIFAKIASAFQLIAHADVIL